MSTGRVNRNKNTRRRPLGHDIADATPSLTTLNDQLLHRRYAAVVMVKIGLRPGNNLDILEALGLIPTVVNR